MKHDRWKFFTAAAVLASAIGIAAPPGWAVDETGLFELEFDANAVDDAADGDDWETLWNDCHVDGDPDGAATSCGNSTVFTGIKPDPSGVSIFGGGEKDIQDIFELSVNSGSVPDKNEIQHAFAAAYTCGDPGAPPAIDCEEGDVIFYFGADRDSHNGDAFLGFWFTKNEIGMSGGSLTGSKSLHDPLVLVNFPQASNAQPIVAVVEWDPSCSKKDDPTPDPTECVAKNLRLVDIAMGEGVVRCDETKNTTPPVPVHTFCASTNDTTQEAPWSYVPKEPDPLHPTWFPFETFYEGGLNFSQLFGEGCVASFLAESRSSSSFTAQLKDLLVADFPLCGINASKSCRTTRLASSGGLCQDTGSTCTVDADCNEGISCSTANPQFIGGSDFVTQFDVTINREGPGTLYDVRFQEKAVSPSASAACTIIAQDGSPVSTPLTFETPLTVVPTLTASSSTLTVECVTDGNVSSNRIIVDAKSSASLTESDLGGENTGADFTLTPATGTCEATVSPDIDITKECLPEAEDFVTAEITATGLEFTIPYKIEVTNSGDEDLVGVNVVDTAAGVDETFDLPAFSGNVHTITGEYSTAFPDGEVGDVFTSGCQIWFSNTASVEAATGAATGVPLDVSSVEDTDTCPLCPDSCPRGD